MMQRPLATPRAYSLLLLSALLPALSFLSPLLISERSAAAPATELRLAPLKIMNRSQLPPEELAQLEAALWGGLSERWPALRPYSPEQVSAFFAPGSAASATESREAIEVGRRLAADLVFWGQLSPIGQNLRLELFIEHARERRSLARHLIWAPSLEELLAQLPRAQGHLIGKARYREANPPPREEENPAEGTEAGAGERSGAAWARFEGARRALDQRQGMLIENQRRIEAARRRELEVLRQEFHRDWELLREELARPIPTSRVARDRFREKLRHFILSYRDREFAAEEVRAAQFRYLWLAQRIQWLRVAGGRFQIGSPDMLPDEQPLSWVEIRSFEISQSEITNAQYQACVEAGACTPPHWDDGRCEIFEFRNLRFGKLPDAARRGDLPVTCVDWSQANRFARWAEGRLLSEAEWEYSARSGEWTYFFPWGREPPSCERAIIAEPRSLGCGMNLPWPVCSRPLGNTSFGACDFTGNVWEWVEDRYQPTLAGRPADGRPVSQGGGRVLRGGGFGSPPSILKASRRVNASPQKLGNYIGLRIARDLDETPQD